MTHVADRVDRAPLALPSDQDATGRSLGDEELRLLEEVVRGGTLTSTRGTFVPQLERRFADRLGTTHALACGSGTAAIHAAVAAIDPEPGDEIVTSAITDMGALAPILYQGAVPCFADVDPATSNLTAETVAARLHDRTSAIIVTHLFGNPAPLGEIAALAASRGIPLIEDCAQAYLASSDGRTVGTVGAIGCFSLQQGKHITAGEGGLVVTSDDALARRMRLFVNKGWGHGDTAPDHEFLALNGRMSELQGAVALAQLGKLGAGVCRRIAMADLLTERLAAVDGVDGPLVRPGDVHTYWKYGLRVDPERVPGGPVALARALRAYDIASAPRYIQKPAFQCRVFTEQRTFGQSRWPFSLARPEAVDYRPERFPGTFEALERILVLPFNERYGPAHVEQLADAIDAAVRG